MKRRLVYPLLRMLDAALRLADRWLERGASVLVRVATWLAARVTVVASIGLVAMLLLGSGYIAVDIVRFNPLRETYRVTVMLPVSGGLLADNDVTLRGVRVGTVRSVELADTGVVAVAEIEAGTRISLDTTAAVQRLSAAGEQYLDLRPSTGEGPYLADGSVIDAARVTTPVTIESFLANTSGLISGLNPQRLTVIVDELDQALAGGPDQLRNVIAGISQAMAGLTGLLPQTTQLIRNLSVIAETTSHAQPDLGTLVRGSGVLFDQLTAADQEVRRLLDLGPGQLATLGGVIAETTDPITDLVTNFVAITRAARLRTPAMRALFPAIRLGSAAMAIPAHDNAFHTLTDIWPRPTCEYDTIPVSPTQVSDGRVRLYNYCVTTRPEIQIRGSANAPRPNLPDNGAGPPPGVRGDELSIPLPAK
ncbi:MCE family protein [Nocardia cyriacigeorgica]|uniref:MCE family protein n=1 Tax=Nocardia cyriacigeorgica TaxID=135487 RepID=A0A6P1CQ92_9NOCA|nr:MCE family protein [Nocardia cyriacigeorgica]NEW33396.1 MCE family protein [Nocardia cyriacigeorgica]